MFERFTTEAKSVVLLSSAEARALHHGQVGSEHILLALLHRPTGAIAEAFATKGIVRAAAVAKVVEIVPRVEFPQPGALQFSAEAKGVLQLALKETLGWGQDQVADHHLLIGVIRAPETIGGRILSDLGLAGDEGAHLVGMLAMTGRPQGSPAAPPLEESVDFGWRGRPIAMAALGAAVLARRAFEVGPLEPLEMQILAFLALSEGHDDVATDAGATADSLATALHCNTDGVEYAIAELGASELVETHDPPGEDKQVTITPTGRATVSVWLTNVIPLLGQWPADIPAADDATG